MFFHSYSLPLHLILSCIHKHCKAPRKKKKNRSKSSSNLLQVSYIPIFLSLQTKSLPTPSQQNHPNGKIFATSRCYLKTLKNPFKFWLPCDSARIRVISNAYFYLDVPGSESMLSRWLINYIRHPSKEIVAMCLYNQHVFPPENRVYGLHQKNQVPKIWRYCTLL